MESVIKYSNFSAKKLSETLKNLALLNAKAKRSVTFPVNVMLQQAIIEGDKEEDYEDY